MMPRSGRSRPGGLSLYTESPENPGAVHRAGRSCLGWKPFHRRERRGRGEKNGGFVGAPGGDPGFSPRIGWDLGTSRGRLSFQG